MGSVTPSIPNPITTETLACKLPKYLSSSALPSAAAFCRHHLSNNKGGKPGHFYGLLTIYVPRQSFILN